MFPIEICSLTTAEAENFAKNFVNEQGELFFEGMWFRNQRPENAAQSGWKDKTTARRRYVHFYDKYVLGKSGNMHVLQLKQTYAYVSNTLPVEEATEYYDNIIKTLKQNNFIKNGRAYEKHDLQVFVRTYDNHPKNRPGIELFPQNYKSVDVIVKTKGYKHTKFYNRMWKHSTKIFRLPETRENPTYISGIEQLKRYLPAQIEMGCGPSIEVGIPPLYDMHESYFVQNHISKKFYFASQDKLMQSIISNPESMAKQFARVPILCIKANATEAYNTFGALHKKGVFVGKVYNNNFDRIVKRYGIDEMMLRIFEINTYLPKIKFDKRAKSLIVFGSHADRREVQKQAREQGLKVIHIDPEGFIEGDKFINYPIEAPKDNDLVWKTTFSNAMKQMQQLLQ